MHTPGCCRPTSQRRGRSSCSSKLEVKALAAAPQVCGEPHQPRWTRWARSNATLGTSHALVPALPESDTSLVAAAALAGCL